VIVKHLASDHPEQEIQNKSDMFICMDLTIGVISLWSIWSILFHGYFELCENIIQYLSQFVHLLEVYE
jgi:hypothetical protein